MALTKANEIKLLQELVDGEGYFADILKEGDLDIMKENIHSDFPLLRGLAFVPRREYEFLEEDYSNLVKETETLHGVINGLIEVMLRSYQEFSDTKLLESAIKLKGFAYVIKRRLEMGMELSEMEKNYLMENLK